MAALDVQIEVAGGFNRKATFLVDSGAAKTIIPRKFLFGMPGLDALLQVKTNMVDANNKPIFGSKLNAILKVDGLTPVHEEILITPEGAFGLLGLTSWFESNKVVFLNKKSPNAADRVFWIKCN